MCEISNKLKFCTCSTVDESKSYWVLKRLGTNFSKDIIGIISSPLRIGKADFIKYEINNRNCFDFEYTPEINDRLIIRLRNPKESFSFVYKKLGDSGFWMRVYLFVSEDAPDIAKGFVSPEYINPIVPNAYKGLDID